MSKKKSKNQKIKTSKKKKIKNGYNNSKKKN